MCCVKCHESGSARTAIGVVWGLYMALCYSCSSITMCGTAEPPPNHLIEHSLLEYTHHTASLPSWLPGTIHPRHQHVVSAWCQLDGVSAVFLCHAHRIKVLTRGLSAAASTPGDLRKSGQRQRHHMAMRLHEKEIKLSS